MTFCDTQALKADGGWLVFDIKGAGATPAENIRDSEGRGVTFYGFSVHACLPSGVISALRQPLLPS